MLAPLDFATTVSLRRPRAVVPPRLADFEIGRYLGGGGMGVVFEGRHLTLGRRVALKFLRHETERHGDARARLVREAQAMARVRHSNVISLFELGHSGEEMFIAMELVEGGTLRDWLRERHSWHDILDMFIRVGRGVACIHAHGIVHRDINPSNVFLERDGTPKLGDFGLALTGDEVDEPMAPGPVLSARITSPGSVLGTPGYMPPEQIRGRTADARSDQFAFCASLYEALTAGGLTRPLRAILSRGLEQAPEARFPSMNVLLAALVRARGSRGRRWIICAAKDNATTRPY
jgi:serine/threonine-protein kinase